MPKNCLKAQCTRFSFQFYIKLHIVFYKLFYSIRFAVVFYVAWHPNKYNDNFRWWFILTLFFCILIRQRDEKEKKKETFSFVPSIVFWSLFRSIKANSFIISSLLPESFIKCKKIFPTLPFHVIVIAPRIRSQSKALIQYIEINIAHSTRRYSIQDNKIIVCECESCLKFEVNG